VLQASCKTKTRIGDDAGFFMGVRLREGWPIGRLTDWPHKQTSMKPIC